jgi:hypothetical protein
LFTYRVIDVEGLGVDKTKQTGKEEDPIDILTRRVQRLSKNPVHRWNGKFEGERADFGRVRP